MADQSNCASSHNAILDVNHIKELFHTVFRAKASVSPSCKNKRGVIRVSALIPFGKCQKHAQTLCGLIVNVTSTFYAGCKACGNRHKILEDICDLTSQVDASKTKVPLATVVATSWPTENGSVVASHQKRSTNNSPCASS